MVRKQSKIKEESNLQEQAGDISKLSIPDLAKKIENQIMDPKIVDKTILEKCAVYFRSRRGYKTADIAEILQVCSRTIERYIKDVKSETALTIGANFQNELLGEVLSDFRFQYQRLWRLSYSDNLSDYEKARTIFMCSQIRLNEVVLLSRLGYLSSEQGVAAIENVKKQMKEMGTKANELIDKRFKSLTSQQWQGLLDVYKARSKETEIVLEKIVRDCEVENERQMKLAGHVDDFTQLRCSVFVINGLRN